MSIRSEFPLLIFMETSSCFNGVFTWRKKHVVTQQKDSISNALPIDFRLVFRECRNVIWLKMLKFAVGININRMNLLPVNIINLNSLREAYTFQSSHIWLKLTPDCTRDLWVQTDYGVVQTRKVFEASIIQFARERVSCKHNISYHSRGFARIMMLKGKPINYSHRFLSKENLEGSWAETETFPDNQASLLIAFNAIALKVSRIADELIPATRYLWTQANLEITFCLYFAFFLFRLFIDNLKLF